jgi:uncharacterized protein (DUF2062 family)
MRVATYAKAIVAAITAFLGLAVMREVQLGFWLEGSLVAAAALLTVFATPNKP